MAVYLLGLFDLDITVNECLDTCIGHVSQPRVKLGTFTRATSNRTFHVLHEPLNQAARVSPMTTRLTPREPRGEDTQLGVFGHVRNIVQIGSSGSAPCAHIHKTNSTPW